MWLGVAENDMTEGRLILWKPHTWDWRRRYGIVWVSIPKVDASWKEDQGYVPPQAVGSDGLAWRYARFGKWLLSSKQQRRVEMPVVGYSGKPCCIGFEDGRHRFAWLRDHGVAAMPMCVYLDHVDIVAAKFGAAERECILAPALSQ
jgi:hypothetical protein